MAAEKNITSRIQQKHDTAANWANATTFIPKKGEIVIYDAEYNTSGEETQAVRFKIGDGSKTVNNLPFAAIDYKSIKSINTNNTAAQEPKTDESIAGSGTINLHKIAKTGNYNDLLHKPTLGTAAEKNVGTSSGNVPILDSNGKLADSVIPAVAITDTYVIDTEEEMLALSAQKGDIAIRSDLNKSYVLQTTPASTLANWKELLTPTDTVLSVNGQTGTVELTASDVKALPSSTKYAASSEVGGAATSANKVNSNLIVKLNSGATEGTNLFTFNGSAAKTINITPSAIGAAASSHGTHVTADTVKSALGTGSGTSKYLREDGTWQIPSDTHYTNYLQIKGNGTEAVKFTQNTDKTLNFKPGTNVSISATSGEITISSTNTNTSHSHSAGIGLVGSGNAGTNNGTYDYKAKLRSETALTVDSVAATTTPGRVYPVAVDKSGYLSVNVPWTDTDTNTHNSHAIISGTKSDNSTQIKGSASSGDIILGDSGASAGSYGNASNQEPGYGTTFNVPYITVNAKGIVTAISNKTVKIPASDNTNTATAADNILDGSNSGTQITYKPYTSQQSKLSFDISTTNPTGTDRLNLNGYLYATKLYSGGKEVLTDTPNDGKLTIKQNGTTVQTFSANQSGNVEANITVPTKVGELENDSGFTSNTGTVTSVAVKMNGETKGTVTSSGTIDLGTVLTDASKFATAAQGTKADNAMPKSGGTFTGPVKFGNTENFQGYYIKRMLGNLSPGTSYNNLDSSYKDGTWHRMWRLRFPSGSSFWGKIKVTLYGDYSSFNASGLMSKSITCNFNTSTIYNNVGCYDGLGVNVEQDFRISEAIWNATANAWEVLIWQKNLNGNNPAVIMLECWTKNNTNYINAFNGIAAQTVELTRSTSYSAQKASSTGGTKTVMWEALPVYENPLGEEIATVAMLEDKQDKITSSNKLSASLVSGLATLTIQKNGTTVQTFSANQNENVTANITVPTFSFSNGVLTITT